MSTALNVVCHDDAWHKREKGTVREREREREKEREMGGETERETEEATEAGTGD
jgi:hypothetical protein